MGISADLYVLISKEKAEQLNFEEFIDDSEEDSTLYDVLPKTIHHLITKEKGEFYDLEKLRKEYNDNELHISSSTSNGKGEFVTFTNGLTLNADDIPYLELEYNIIYMKSICYLGSKQCFNEHAYHKHNNNIDFPSLFKLNELDKIYSFNQGFDKKELLKLLSKYSEDELIVDLNY
jgi:hypothetical protein